MMSRREAAEFRLVLNYMRRNHRKMDMGEVIGNLVFISLKLLDQVEVEPNVLGGVSPEGTSRETTDGSVGGDPDGNPDSPQG